MAKALPTRARHAFYISCRREAQYAHPGADEFPLAGARARSGLCGTPGRIHRDQRRGGREQALDDAGGRRDALASRAQPSGAVDGREVEPLPRAAHVYPRPARRLDLKARPH